VPELGPGTGADTLHGASHPQSTWTTTNVGEAVPGVQTPLGWSIWGPAGERGLRSAFHAIGALSASELELPASPADRLFGVFCGRAAMHLDLLCGWADRIPGTDGAAMASQIFTFVPPGYTSRPARRYYPRVLARAGVPWVQGPRRIRASRAHMAGFWQQSLAALPGLDAEGARLLLLRAADEFGTVIRRHTVLTLGAVQPVYDLLEKVCAGSAISAQQLMGGHGNHEETALVRDLWACSRDRLPLAEFIARYGYHGPQEGDISSVVWRENPTPVQRLATRYRETADDRDPVALERELITQRRRLEARFLAGLPPARRVPARLALAVGARFIPLRGVGKVAFLQGIDVTRAAARRLGALRLEDPDDVFFLVLDDLRDGWPADAAALISERRSFYEHYKTLELPEVWQGDPRPVAAAPLETRDLLSGIGASPGVVEGVARVILDPADAEVDDGDILIARSTDPAWASIMFLSGGLVSDIGGLMSHTAVVARELGLPCVVNTRTATRRISTGDIVRLDGTAGTIEVIRREPSPTPP
jgi:pyruvate,water dikinase